MNGAAGNFLATAEDLKTKGFKVRGWMSVHCNAGYARSTVDGII